MSQAAYEINVDLKEKNWFQFSGILIYTSATVEAKIYFLSCQRMDTIQRQRHIPSEVKERLKVKIDWQSGYLSTFLLDVFKQRLDKIGEGGTKGYMNILQHFESNCRRKTIICKYSLCISMTFSMECTALTFAVCCNIFSGIGSSWDNEKYNLEYHFLK